MDRHTGEVLVVCGPRDHGERVALALELCGYRVSIVRDRLTAIRLAPSARCLLVDDELPDALGLCSSLRALGIRAPRVVMAVTPTTAKEKEALDGDADDYVALPEDLGPLIARLRKHTSRDAERDPAELRVGEIVVRLRERQVLVADRDCQFTAREFALVELLARSPGAVVTWSDVLERFGVRTANGRDRFYVHLFRVRDKLGSQAGPRLVTVHGKGLMLTA